MASPSAIRSAEPAGAGLRTAGSAGLLLVATLLAYFPALRGGMLWDDDAHVTKAALRSLPGLKRIWFELGATQQYYPVLHSAFWIEHRLWGDSVLGYHLLNVLLHATAAWLLVLILRRLAIPGAYLAGMIFALHPVGVESVAWISEQKNTLSTVFYLGSALVYLKWVGTRGSRVRSPGGPIASTERTDGRAARPYLYLLATLLFVLALLSKSVTATLPAALLLIAWWQRSRLSWKNDIVPLLPWLAVGAGVGLLSAWVERAYIGAQGAGFDLSFLQRALLAGRIVWFYLGKLLWPANLIFIYPHWTVRANDLIWWMPLIAAVGVTVLLLKVGRIILNPQGMRANADGANGGLGIIRPTFSNSARACFFAWAFFVLTLFPALGFVNVYPFVFSYVADHFQYLASLGIIALFAVAWMRWMPAPAITAALLLGVLGTLTWRQCRIYRDADTLNRATLERNPGAWLAHYNLAVSLGRDPGRRAEAIAEYEATLRLKPDHWAAHSNLASALLQVPGRADDAIAEYETALRLHPGFAEAHNDLGVVLSRLPGRRPEAETHLRAALRLRPDYDAAHNNLGVLLMREPGGLKEAIGEFTAALRTAPTNAEYHYNLADALSDSGRLTEAVAEYRAALRLRPGSVEAHANLGAVLARLPGQSTGAIAEYETASRLAPDNPRIHERLGILLAGDPRRLPEAVAEFETAIRLAPGLAEAHYCLGVVLLRAHDRRAEAIRQLREALRLRPDFSPARTILRQLGVLGG